jgi:hypothetical protein
MEPVFVVDSFDDLLRVYDDACAGFRQRPWFRGHADRRWELLPSVFRWMKDRRLPRTYESSIAQKFIARARIRYSDCPDDGDHFGWLTLMRHYGLFTRLLDWSESILIAAYFAVDAPSGEGPSAVWALNPYAMNVVQFAHYDVPLSPNNPHVRRQAEDALTGETQIVRALAVVPRETDLRMLVQQSVFTIHGSQDPLEGQQGTRAPEWLKLYEISAPFRARLRRALGALGITRAHLFPDLENLSRDILELELPGAVPPTAADSATASAPASDANSASELPE